MFDESNEFSRPAQPVHDEAVTQELGEIGRTLHRIADKLGYDDKLDEISRTLDFLRFLGIVAGGGIIGILGTLRFCALIKEITAVPETHIHALSHWRSSRHGNGDDGYRWNRG